MTITYLEVGFAAAGTSGSLCPAYAELVSKEIHFPPSSVVRLEERLIPQQRWQDLTLPSVLTCWHTLTRKMLAIGDSDAKVVGCRVALSKTIWIAL